MRENISTKTKKKNKLFVSIAKDIPAWVLLLPAILCIYIVIIRPQIQGIYWSFFSMNGFEVGEFVGLENYSRVISNSMFTKTLWNTFEYVIWSLVVGFLLPIIVAIMLNEMVHLRNTFRVVIYLPSIMPGVATALLWYLMYYPDRGGLLNMILEYINLPPSTWLQDPKHVILYIVISMTWSGMGGTVIYYFASLQGVSRELFEAALIDGAGFFKRLRTVTIPHIAPITLLFLVKQIIGVFSVMEQPMQMTDGGPNGASMTLGLLSYRYAFKSGKPELAMAVGVIMFLILMVMTVFYFWLDKKLSDNY